MSTEQDITRWGQPRRNVRLILYEDAEWVQRIDAAARRNGLTRSDLLRRIVRGWFLEQDRRG